MSEDMLNDPSMKEIVDEFCEETLDLCEQMLDVLESFEDSPTSNELLEKFGQMVDRIMGTALTFGLNRIGTICSLCKKIGYKSSQSSDQALNIVVAGVLMDAVDLIDELIREISTKKERKEVNFDAFISRLNWLTEKFKHIERSSLVQGEKTTEEEFEALIKLLG